MSVKSFRDVGVAIKDSELAKVTASASTLQELISTIPRAYQAVLGDHLTRKYRIAQKHANVQSTVAQYDRHDKEKSFPPVILNALKEPKLQFAKEYLGTTTGADGPTVFKASVFSARKSVLTSAIAQKTKELEHLATLIIAEPDVWQKSVRTVAEKVALANGGLLKWDETHSRFDMEGCPPTALTEFATAFRGCEIYTYRVLALARAAIDRTELQKLAKIKLKDTTDVEMTDAPARDGSVRDLIREEIKSLEKKQSQSMAQILKKLNGPAGRVQKKTSGKKKTGGGNKQKKKSGKKSR